MRPSFPFFTKKKKDNAHIVLVKRSMNMATYSLARVTYYMFDF